MTLRSGRPSPQHERRLKTLETLAMLNGFNTAMPLASKLRPDVALWRRVDRAVFVGEAKHSEAPTDGRAMGRLARYLQLLRPREDSAADIIAVCHPLFHGGDWIAALRQLAADGLLAAAPPRLVRLSAGEAITWMACGGALGEHQVTPRRA